MAIIFVLACLVVAAESVALVLLITPRRTYYPLLRWVFGLLAGVYFAGAVGALTYSGQGDPRARLVSVLATAVVLGWALVFVRRRNRVAQYIPTDYRGLPLPVDYDGVEMAVLVACSFINHGESAPEVVDRFRAAIKSYDEMTEDKRRAWVRHLAQQAAERKKQRSID